MDVFALAALKKAKSAQESVDRLGVPLEFKGVVSTYKDLPFSGNSKGDIYFTSSDGFEYVWTSILSSGYHWEKLGSNAAGAVYIFEVSYDTLQEKYVITVPEESIDTIYNNLYNGAAGWISYNQTNAPYQAPKEFIKICQIDKDEVTNKYYLGSEGLVGVNSSNNNEYVENIRLNYINNTWSVDVIYKEIPIGVPTSTSQDAGSVLTVGQTGAAEWIGKVDLSDFQNEFEVTVENAIIAAETSGFFGVSLNYSGSETTVEKANIIHRAAIAKQASALGFDFSMLLSYVDTNESHIEGYEGDSVISFMIPAYMVGLTGYTIMLYIRVYEQLSDNTYVPILSISATAMKLINYPA